MNSLALSTPLALRPVLLQSPPSTSAVFVYPTGRPVIQSLKSSLTSFPYQISSSSSPPLPGSPLLGLSNSSTQISATATRGGEADAMVMLLRERIVFLGGQIDDFVADAIISQILLLDAQDPTKDIRLFINSPGGSLSATMGIFDAVRVARADVSTIAFGCSVSSASIVLGGGTKGKRFAMPNTRIMIHQPFGSAGGEAEMVEIQVREVMHSKTTVISIISEFTGRSFEQVEEDIDRDRYMSPIEAVEYGIIDGVIDKHLIIPNLPVLGKVDGVLFEEKFTDPEIPDDEIY